MSDIRNFIAAAVSYELTTPPWGCAASAILRGRAVDALVSLSSAPPINVETYIFSPAIDYYRGQADALPGQPYWIADSSQPVGRALNPAVFAIARGRQ